MPAAAEACAEEPLITNGAAAPPSPVEPRDSASWACPKPRLPACCHRGAKSLGAAYKQYFTIDNAKILSLTAVSLLLMCHLATRYYSGSDSCQWLLSTGHFVENDMWEPEGCLMHNYSRIEAKDCLEGKQVVFIGDSRIWHLFISFVNIMVSKTYTPKWRHVDIFYKIENSKAQVHFLWDPYTNIHLEKRVKSLSQAPVKPAAVLIGSGAWEIAIHGKGEGLLPYKTTIKSMKENLEKLAQYGDVHWHMQEPVRWPALKAYQRNITNKMIDLYNDAAAEALNLGSSIIRPFEASRLGGLQRYSEIPDGLHMPVRVRDTSAMVLMNRLCNKVVRPIDGSCCQNMPPITFLQKTTLCLFLGSAVLFLVLHFLMKRPHRLPGATDVESLEDKKPATAAGLAGVKTVCGALCRMGFIMVYFYLCDRANVFMKEQKHYSHSAFFIPLVVVFVLGLFWSERTKESHLLNREQTDEWKGWMQVAILIYHVSGASAYIPVYMHVRVLVAAYLFQTGYGHFSFFWLKADFGLYRVCQVLFRLNFLVLLLCVVMDKPYQFYYFVPLVTFWFVIIYSTMALWPQIVQAKANNSVIWYWGILLKLLGLLLLICFAVKHQVLFEKTFTVWPLSTMFELNGSIHEWWFRWKLDRFAVIQGMVFAFLYLLLQKKQVLREGRGDSLFSAKVSIPLWLLSLMFFIAYSLWASNCKSKTECNEMHSFISVVSILAFILIRNIPGCLRSRYSSFFAWFGKISLELFICQYHIWLAADTKGILVLIPTNPSLNIVVSSFIFVCVAHEVSLITNTLAQLLIPKNTVALLKRLGALGLFCLVLLATPFISHNM